MSQLIHDRSLQLCKRKLQKTRVGPIMDGARSSRLILRQLSRLGISHLHNCEGKLALCGLLTEVMKSSCHQEGLRTDETNICQR